MGKRNKIFGGSVNDMRYRFEIYRSKGWREVKKLMPICKDTWTLTCEEWVDTCDRPFHCIRPLGKEGNGCGVQFGYGGSTWGPRLPMVHVGAAAQLALVTFGSKTRFN
ncbi:hypothetical protein V6N13_039798 [Hibiscus sabdariffa]|uniref:Uncharacterized protein n=1 Tax=Hibiscus sabdariffa TaxID=183260 RepID=A0ABR2SV64_9ROSI